MADNERPVVVTTGGNGGSSVAIVAIVVLFILVLLVFMVFMRTGTFVLPRELRFIFPAQPVQPIIIPVPQPQPQPQPQPTAKPFT